MSVGIMLVGGSGAIVCKLPLSAVRSAALPAARARDTIAMAYLRGYQSTVEKVTLGDISIRGCYVCLTIWPYSENEPYPKTFKVQNRTQEAGVYDSKYISISTMIALLTVLWKPLNTVHTYDINSAKTNIRNAIETDCILEQKHVTKAANAWQCDNGYNSGVHVWLMQLNDNSVHKRYRSSRSIAVRIGVTYSAQRGMCFEHLGLAPPVTWICEVRAQW